MDGLIWYEGTNGLVCSSTIRGMVRQALRTETLLSRGGDVHLEPLHRMDGGSHWREVVPTVYHVGDQQKKKRSGAI